ncbi:MAG: hypothetical protein LC642_07180 [Verrucomicrobiaceae bacterium]|nr:hypothetical protein [Verrucomicrobiaceae bacterium]
MARPDYFSSFAWLCVRLVLALVLIFAVVGLFQAPVPAAATNKPWIGPNAPTLIPVWFYALVFLGSALLLIAGWNVPVAVIAVSSMLIVISLERLVRNPFTNLTADVLLIMGLALALFVAGPGEDRWSVDAYRGAKQLPGADRWSWLTLFLRLFIGAIFLSQGDRRRLTRQSLVSRFAFRQAPPPFLIRGK